MPGRRTARKSGRRTARRSARRVSRKVSRRSAKKSGKVARGSARRVSRRSRRNTRRTSRKNVRRVRRSTRRMRGGAAISNLKDIEDKEFKIFLLNKLSAGEKFKDLVINFESGNISSANKENITEDYIKEVAGFNEPAQQPAAAAEAEAAAKAEEERLAAEQAARTEMLNSEIKKQEANFAEQQFTVHNDMLLLFGSAYKNPEDKLYSDVDGAQNTSLLTVAENNYFYGGQYPARFFTTKDQFKYIMDKLFPTARREEQRKIFSEDDLRILNEVIEVIKEQPPNLVTTPYFMFLKMLIDHMNPEDKNKMYISNKKSKGETEESVQQSKESAYALEGVIKGVLEKYKNTRDYRVLPKQLQDELDKILVSLSEKGGRQLVVNMYENAFYNNYLTGEQKVTTKNSNILFMVETILKLWLSSNERGNFEDSKITPFQNYVEGGVTQANAQYWTINRGLRVKDTETGLTYAPPPKSGPDLESTGGADAALDEIGDEYSLGWKIAGGPSTPKTYFNLLPVNGKAVQLFYEVSKDMVKDGNLDFETGSFQLDLVAYTLFTSEKNLNDCKDKQDYEAVLKTAFNSPFAAGGGVGRYPTAWLDDTTPLKLTFVNDPFKTEIHEKDDFSVILRVIELFENLSITKPNKPVNIKLVLEPRSSRSSKISEVDYNNLHTKIQATCTLLTDASDRRRRSRPAAPTQKISCVRH